MTAPRVYLYGTGNAALRELLPAPAFHRLVRRLLADGAVEPCAETSALINRCVACDLLSPQGRGYRSGSRLVVVPVAAAAVMAHAVANRLDRYEDEVAVSLPLIQRAFSSTAVATRFEWAQVSHAIAAGMFLDLAVGSALWRSGIVQRRCSDTVVWAIETVPGRNSFGVQWVGSAATRCALAQLWHTDVARPELRVAESAVLWVRTAARGGRPAGDARTQLYLRYLGVVSGGGDDARVRVPTFGPTDCERLFSVLTECALRLVRRVIRSLLADMERDWPMELGPPNDSSRHIGVRMVLELGIDRVVSAGLLARFPSGVPPADWGRWFWEESASGHSLVAGAFDTPRRLAAAL